MASSSSSFSSVTVNNAQAIRSSSRPILEKCNVALVDGVATLQRLESVHRRPHTSFYQRRFGDINCMNYRTSDTISSHYRQRSTVQNDTIVDIFKANVRFQAAVKGSIVARHMLIELVDKFNVALDDLSRLEQQVTTTTTTTTTSPIATTRNNDAVVAAVTEEEVRNVRVTADDDLGVSSTVSTAPMDSRSITERIIVRKRQLERLTRSIQTMINQLVFWCGCLKIELQLLSIYDNYDDSDFVHEFLVQHSNVLQNLCPEGASHALQHEWSALTSSEAIRSWEEGLSSSRPSAAEEAAAAPPRQAQCVLNVRL